MAGRQPRRKAFFFTALLPTLIALSAAGDTVFPGYRMEDGGSLVSSNGSFKLGFFSPGKSNYRYLGIWYNRISVQTVVWVANRDRPLTNTTGVLSISINGSLSLSDSKGIVYWSTPSTRLAGKPVAKLLDDANFVVAGGGEGGYAWQSFDHPTDAFLPGMKLWVDRRTGLTRNFTSWKSDDDPGTGDCSFFLDSVGDPQITFVQGSKRVWRSGPWVGGIFSGIPEMSSYDDFNFSFVSNADEAYYQYSTLNKSFVSRMVAQPKGLIQRLVWVEGERNWTIFWSGPRDHCDEFGICGIFGVCDADESPLCTCLQGFEPKSPENWHLRDWKEGCGRKTALDCQNGTDGFVSVANAKLPDTSVATVNENMGREECREACLRNCSCTAYATAEIRDGGRSACTQWSGVVTDLRVYRKGGQDLFIRLSHADLGLSPGKANRRRVVVAASAAVGVLVGMLLFGLVAGLAWRRRKSSNTVVLGNCPTVKNRTWNEEMARSTELDLPLLDLGSIAAATNHFSTDNLLGEGGFGPVYKGRLEGTQEVAVKRLAKSSLQGVEQFMNEVRLIAKLQHRNLVRLLGCCIDGEERILVYEYMPNKGLDSFLFDKSKAALLDWATRWRIITGVARGLLYLHQDSRFRIIHRDLKAGNVLLDDDMNPKISDFGMARIFAGDETEGITRRVVGTYGYMSPEYAMDGSFSVKSDVYSFGVLVLEILSGRRNRGISRHLRKLNLLGYAWSLWKEGKGLELVDSSLGYPIPMAEVLKCIQIGLLCVQDQPEDRPEMAAVVLMLGGDRAALPPPKQPEFIVARLRGEGSSTSSKGLSRTFNDVTVSAIDGR